MIFDIVLRLEPDPHQRDLARGWAAELADPAWLLGRQWQMGEHQGEDASSPVAVEIRSRATPIGAVAGQAGLDPATVPAQAIIESEPQDWWTPGRRIRIGRLVAAAAAAQPHPVTLPESVTLTGLPVPYQDLNGTGPDGRALWQQRSTLHSTLGLEESWFGQPGPPRDEPGRPVGPCRARLHRRTPRRRHHAHHHPARRRRPRLVPRRRHRPPGPGPR